MAENFPNLKKETDIQVQEAQRVPNKMNPNRPAPRHMIIKMAKVKERILKAAREKQRVNYKGNPIRLSADFSTETLQARREWQNIFKVLKEKNLQSRILYPARLSFRIGEKIKNFSEKQKLKEYSNTESNLKEILKGLLQIEKKQEDIERRKSQLESKSLKLASIQIKKKKTKKKPICESDDKQKNRKRINMKM